MNIIRRQLFPVVLGSLLATSASAQLIRIGDGDFTPSASVITFNELALGTVNPAFNVATATLGTVGVKFGSHFQGQSRSGSFPITLTGHPEGLLALDLSAGSVFITHDGSRPTTPVLSGSPTFNGPISVLFSSPVAAVGFDGGYFNSIGSTSIEAFDASGASLGLVHNQALGIEFFGVVHASGDNVIAGVSFYITGVESGGFSIDNFTFGSASEVSTPGGFTPVPEPSTYTVFAALGLILAVGSRRLRSRTDAAATGAT
jgi:hypothetical protein